MLVSIEEDLTTTDTKTEWKYSRHSRTVRVNDPQKFKTRLLKCQKKYSHIAIFADFISIKKQFRLLIGSVIGGIAVVVKILIDLFWQF